MCNPIYNRCAFLCNCLNSSQKPFKSHLKEKWHKAVESVGVKYGYKWKYSRWRVNSLQNLKIHQRRDTLKKVHQEIGQFVLDKTLSVDILRKCFLIQVRKLLKCLEFTYVYFLLLIYAHVRGSICRKGNTNRNMDFCVQFSFFVWRIPKHLLLHFTFGFYSMW